MPVKALGLVKDLLFRSKLEASATATGIEIVYASDLDSAARRCVEIKPAVVFADLSESAFPPGATASAIRTAAPDARLIGFASHVDVKSLKAARDAGFDAALSRSELTSRLGELLRAQSAE
ncbi:MAG TPA: hypothetical protein VEF03_05450 [Candidatus Binataceae bacterium]|nr:hypothetical protein [Candidatus Binataceae bacterium]